MPSDQQLWWAFWSVALGFAGLVALAVRVTLAKRDMTSARSIIPWAVAVAGLTSTAAAGAFGWDFTLLVGVVAVAAVILSRLSCVHGTNR
jgi:hypothetical protein